ncbi:hypothetical protein PVK06_024584 [Gossypium arboreum]|uniref:Uncharacterized protein n=1 Tax=Gossypium arboreum TaxID=29729 RepID=A0ABR0PEC2_GOSAR|nr:hypothetical protein PVK06_024584 [Gossypium arboreum]
MDKGRFHNMLNCNFYPEQGISLLPQQDLGKRVSKTISKLKWETFCTHPGSYSPSLQRGIVPCANEEVLENKGPINEASLERMTRGKVLPILKEAKTNKTRNGKDKVDRKRTNLNAETSLWSKLNDAKKLVNSINNMQIRLVATVEDIEKSQNLFYAYTRAWNSSIVAILGQLSLSLLPEFPMFPPIIRNYDPCSSDNDLEDQDRPVSDTKKEEESRNIEECLRKIDSLFEDGIFVNQEDIVVEKEVAATEEEIAAEE